MKLILIISAIILLTGCNHYKYFVRHQDELCQLCPKSDSTVIQYRDTVLKVNNPWDTIEFVSLNMLEDSVYTLHSFNGAQANVSKKKDKTTVRFKPVAVAVAVPKYFKRQVRTVTVDKTVEVCRSWWKWLIGGFILAVILAVVWRVSKRF